MWNKGDVLEGTGLIYDLVYVIFSYRYDPRVINNVPMCSDSPEALSALMSACTSGDLIWFEINTVYCIVLY